MAYVSISNTAIDQDSPITVSLMTALRDNPTAIANGDSGAPKIQTAGINDSAVTTAKIADSAVTAAKLGTDLGLSIFPASTAASTYCISRHYFDGDYVTGGRVEKEVLRAGGYRVRAIGYASSSVSIFVNGSSVTTLSSYTDSSAQTYDLTLSAGDDLSLRVSGLAAAEDARIEIWSSQPFTFYLSDG